MPRTEPNVDKKETVQTEWFPLIYVQGKWDAYGSMTEQN